MNWYPCEVCGKAHPFRVPRDRGCPNEALLRVVAGGKERSERGLSSRISVEARGEVSESDSDSEKGRDQAASTDPDPAAGVSKGSYRYRDREARKEYMKEYMRKRRLRGKVP